jgi:predicted enzyme related to lactoylglutathione lyase
MSRVVHFELGADDPERAIRFYRQVFGWDINQWGDQRYWLVSTGKDGPGIDGAIAPRGDTLAGVVNTIGVGSLDDAIERIKANGGEIVLPRTAVPGVGWLAYFKDPEGNISGVIQPDEGAR